MARDLWTEALDRIKLKVPPQIFTTWFKPTRLLARDAGTLTVGVPNPLFAEWLRSNYQWIIAESVREADGQGWEIFFHSPDEQRRDAAPVPALGPQFDARYTFESFVVGSANQFAHAGALAVAEQPSKAYNPL